MTNMLKQQKLFPLMRMNFVCPEHGPMTATRDRFLHRIDYRCVSDTCSRLHSWPLPAKQPWYSRWYMQVIRLRYWLLSYKDYAATKKLAEELSVMMQINARKVAWQKECCVPLPTCMECDSLGLGIDDGSDPLICHECCHFMWTSDELETFRANGFDCQGEE